MAARLTIAWQPLDGAAIEDAAEAATWAQLRLAVVEDGAERVLTLVESVFGRTTRDHVVDTVLPLAEWVVRSWCYLHVPAHPPRDADAAWTFARTHRLRFAAEGGPLPDLLIVRESSRNMLLRWRADRGAQGSGRVRFLDSGEARVAVAELRAELWAFVEGVLERLRALAPAHPRTIELAAMWQANSQRSVDSAAQRVAAVEGRWWWEQGPTDHQRWRRLAEVGLLPFVEAVWSGERPESYAAAEDAAKRLAVATEGAAPARQEWLELRAAFRHGERSLANGVPPWTLGWERAAALRAIVGDEIDEPVAVRAGVSAHVAALDDPSGARVRVAWRADGGPVYGSTGERAESAKRFAAATALYPMLAFGSPDRDTASILHRDVQVGLHSEARAFATELVAPIAQVRALVGDAVEDERALAEAARVLRAPRGCVFHQVRNRLVPELI